MQQPGDSGTAAQLTAEATEVIDRWLDFRLFTLGESDIVVSDVLVAGLILLLGFVASRTGRRIVKGVFRARRIYDEGLIGTVQRLVSYAIMVTFTLWALSMVGIDLSTLFAAGAIAAVAVGFALQTILQNFVAGIILLVERSITPLDVLSVDGQIVRVVDMRIRSTIARTLDEEEIIIPNAQLVSSSVKNYTLRDSLLRIRCTVGVSYSSDVEQVLEVLNAAGAAVEDRYDKKDPVVLFTGFGDSTLNFEVSIWIKDPWTTRASRSALNLSMWRHLREAGITVAFPQMDVHFDPGIFDRRTPGTEGGDAEERPDAHS